MLGEEAGERADVGDKGPESPHRGSSLSSSSSRPATWPAFQSTIGAKPLPEALSPPGPQEPLGTRELCSSMLSNQAEPYKQISPPRGPPASLRSLSAGVHTLAGSPAPDAADCVPT